MRRLLSIALVILAAGALAVLGTGASSDTGGREYEVEIDNAFGLIEGGDLKVAGVRAGKITSLELDRSTRRAVVGFRVDEVGFGSLRRDVRCDVRPQSLIGEYFVDCLPGTDRRELPEGTRIPVSRTTSTIPADLVNNILRRPYRERLSLILGELGAGVAGNAGNLNAALKRANPALRETDRVLAILAKQNRVLADLVRDADTVVGDLAGNRRDVGRFVGEARDTAVASAERQADIAAGFRRLPGFLRELRPTMAALGSVADEQTPALRDLSASAGELERLFDNLPPFADASRPAFRSLGRASQVGRGAVRSARSTVSEARRFARGTPELGGNLATVLEHLDDREHAVEDDPRSPGGKGYTGLEALLTYVFDQTLSTNIFDRSKHLLKVAVFESPCADYADAKTARELGEQCAATLGPNQPGINVPDPTLAPGETFDGDDSVTVPGLDSGNRRAPRRRGTPRERERSAAPGPQAPGGRKPDPGRDEAPRRKLDLGPLLPGGKLPDLAPLPEVALPQLNRSDDSLLDYLLGP